MLRLETKQENSNYIEVWTNTKTWICTVRLEHPAKRSGQDEPIPVGVIMRDCSSHDAASLQHALELGIASGARWIAVELLKHSKPPTKKKIVDGVALWIVGVGTSKEFHTVRLHSSNSKRGSHIVLGTLDIREELCGISDVISSIDCTGWCATKEQAIDIIIHQSAPWIAAAIVEQIESKP